MTVEEYFLTVKEIRIPKDDKLLEVSLKNCDQLIYLPVSQCWSPLGLEYGLKNVQKRLNYFIQNLQKLVTNMDPSIEIVQTKATLQIATRVDPKESK